MNKRLKRVTCVAGQHQGHYKLDWSQRQGVRKRHLKSRELEGALADEHAVVVEPPLRPELLGVVAPQELHPAHGVRLVVHHVPFLDGVPVRQRVIRKAVLDILVK